MYHAHTACLLPRDIPRSPFPRLRVSVSPTPQAKQTSTKLPRAHFVSGRVQHQKYPVEGGGLSQSNSAFRSPTGHIILQIGLIAEHPIPSARPCVSLSLSRTRLTSDKHTQPHTLKHEYVTRTRCHSGDLAAGRAIISEKRATGTLYLR